MVRQVHTPSQLANQIMDGQPYTFYYPDENYLIEISAEDYEIMRQTAIFIQEKLVDTKAPVHIVWEDARGDDYHQYFVFDYNTLLREIIEQLVYVRRLNKGKLHYISDAATLDAFNALPEDQKVKIKRET